MKNPYRPGTVIYDWLAGALEENGWSDLTPDEIAEGLVEVLFRRKGPGGEDVS